MGMDAKQFPRDNGEGCWENHGWIMSAAKKLERTMEIIIKTRKRWQKDEKISVGKFNPRSHMFCKMNNENDRLTCLASL